MDSPRVFPMLQRRLKTMLRRKRLKLKIYFLTIGIMQLSLNLSVKFCTTLAGFAIRSWAFVFFFESSSQFFVNFYLLPVGMYNFRNTNQFVFYILKFTRFSSRTCTDIFVTAFQPACRQLRGNKLIIFR